MDIYEAFYKQKDELHAAQREIKKLVKQLDKYIKGTASDEKYQKLLSKIQYLTNQVTHFTRESEHYKELSEKYKKKVKELDLENDTLKTEILHLEDRIELLGADSSSGSANNMEDAEAQIKALKDEVARLTARLETNGTNAGIPTSKTAIGQKKVIPNAREKSGKNKGGQPGHEKHEMAPFHKEEITDWVEHEAAECPNCGSHNLEEISTTTKDEYDYEVKVIKRRHTFHEYVCADCGKSFKVPVGKLVAPNQYGNVIQSMALSLMNLGFVSVNRTRKLISGFSPEPISLSDGYLIKLQKRYSDRLQDFVAEVKNYLLGLPLLYWDDTVVFIMTERACLRFYGNENLALYTAHLHKDLEGIMDDNILPALSDATTVMHDHNTINYHQGFIFRNVECQQHLIRDLQKIYDASGHSWAKDLQELIKSKIHERKLLIADGKSSFSKKDVCSFISKAKSLLVLGYKEYFKDLGHYFEKDENALLKRLEAYSDNYFEWVKNFDIPTTNNLSERSLRFVKTKDKVSGQFQSVDYASYFADIRTYLETCARNGINEFQALLRLTNGNPYTLNELLGGA